MNPEPHYVALVGAGSLEVLELKSRLTEMGVEESAILVFGPKLGTWEMSVEDDAAAIYLPLDEELLRKVGTVFLFTSDAQARQFVLDWAERAGALVLDLSPEAGLRDGWCNPLADADTLRSRGALLSFPAPAALFLGLALNALEGQEIPSVDCHLFLPASIRGEAGVDELFQQSVSLLNFKPLPTEIFGRQVAFNLFPSEAQPGGDLFGDQVRCISNRQVTTTLVSMQTPVFHNTGLSSLVHLQTAADPERRMRAVLKRQGYFHLFRGERWPSPVEVGQLESPVLGVRRLRDDVLWIWMLFDNVKAGMGPLAARAFKSLRGKPANGQS
jgi:hypothetical protein